jgi:hypothetical protein
MLTYGPINHLFLYFLVFNSLNPVGFLCALPDNTEAQHFFYTVYLCIPYHTVIASLPVVFLVEAHPVFCTLGN